MSAAESPPTHDEADVRASRKWAVFYRDRGFNPLPSRPEEKRPFVRWSEFTDRPFPAEQFERFATANMQVVCGRRWGLVVVDLDGPEAIEHWAANYPRTPRTWITHSGGDGRHIWFSAPTDGPPIPSGRIWSIWEPEARDGRGDWRKHVAVEVLGDKKLVMAPPSIHPGTGRKYRFLAGNSPREVSRPAPGPAWLLRAPILKAPRPEYVPAAGPRKAPIRPVDGSYSRDDVQASIADKVALAESWGLRVASRRPNQSGWCPCHAIGREDRSPSASFQADAGLYWEPDAGRSISLFDLGVRLGIYGDWREAIDDLGRRFGARSMPSQPSRNREENPLHVRTN